MTNLGLTSVRDRQISLLCIDHVACFASGAAGGAALMEHDTVSKLDTYISTNTGHILRNTP